MGFLFGVIVIWAVAMVAWFVVSKYFRSSDAGRVKARLLGTSKPKKSKGGAAGEPTVIQKDTITNNRLAQLMVEKFQWGPKIALLVEQAGLKWHPSRLV